MKSSRRTQALIGKRDNHEESDEVVCVTNEVGGNLKKVP